MKLTENQIRRIVRKVIAEATRNPYNLESDLEQLPIGGTLSLQIFSGQGISPSNATIKRVEDGFDEYSDEMCANFVLKNGPIVLGPMPSYAMSNAVGEFAY